MRHRQCKEWETSPTLVGWRPCQAMALMLRADAGRRMHWIHIRAGGSLPIALTPISFHSISPLPHVRERGKRPQVAGVRAKWQSA